MTDGLLAVRGLVLAMLLGPTAFGAWALFRLATGYAGFAGLGVNRGMEYHVARLDPGATTGPAHLRAVLGFGVVVFGSIAVLALVLSFWPGNPSLALGLRWFAAAVVAEQLWFHQMVYLRARGALRLFATYEIATAALHAILASAFAVRWGVSGAFAGYVLAYVIGLGLLALRTHVVPSFSLQAVRQDIRIGLPVIIALFLSTGVATADRFVVAAYGGVSLLGQYAFAASISGLAASVVLSIRTVVFPVVYASTDTHAPAEGLGQFVRATLRPFATLLPPLLGALALAIAPVVAVAFPQFGDAVPAARLFIFTGATLGLAALGTVGVVAAGRQGALAAYSAAALLVNVVLSVTALGTGLGLEGVAMAALISAAGYGGCVLWLVGTSAGTRNATRFVLSLLAPLAWCVACVVGLSRARPGLAIGETLGTEALYALLLLPLAGRMASAAQQALLRTPRASR